MADQDTAELTAKVALVVPKNHVKTVKSALEQANQLDRSSKILPESSQDTTRHAAQQARFPLLSFDVESGQYVDSSQYADASVPPQQSQHQPPGASAEGSKTKFPALDFDPVRGEYVDASNKAEPYPPQQDTVHQRMRIPTTISYPPGVGETSADLIEENGHRFKTTILRNLNLHHLCSDIELAHHVASAGASRPSAIKSPVHKALKEGLSAIGEAGLLDVDVSPEALVSAFPDGYSLYKPMLLLPHNAFSSPPWKTLLSKTALDSKLLEPIWKRVAEAVGATHVAVNSPIPLRSNSSAHADSEASPRSQENILRSPVDLVPIYGYFGPSPTPGTMSCPTAADFEQALWVAAKQNGIWQVWAPRYTMFSRGNIREKTRILNLPSVANDFDVPSAAVDLYAGIGYFAFSYRKSGHDRTHGIRRVMCWELNPWSVEGLRRGAEKNGWACSIIKGDGVSHVPSESELQEADFWVFQASNEGANEDYASVLAGSDSAACKLPVRHVNLGLLPSSRPSWEVAVRMLDEQRGGWIHVHENVGMRDIESRSRDIEDSIAQLIRHEIGRTDRAALKMEHVEWVKMYAPGVVHCVFDVHVPGVH